MMKSDEKESHQKPRLVYLKSLAEGERRLAIVARRDQPIREGDGNLCRPVRCGRVIPMPRRDEAS